MFKILLISCFGVFANNVLFAIEQLEPQSQVAQLSQVSQQEQSQNQVENQNLSQIQIQDNNQQYINGAYSKGSGDTLSGKDDLNHEVNSADKVANNSSDAMEFALQAGSIAGVIQACNEDITKFSNRVVEALNILGTNSQEKMLAIAYFKKTEDKAYVAQNQKHLIPCSQALNQYNNLPILRDDYQKTVIAKLTDSNSAN